MNTIRMSNSLDPDQAQRFVAPDLGPTCLQRLSADDTRSKELNFLPIDNKFLTKHILILPSSFPSVHC